MRLLDRGFFRVGGEDYADQNNTYGLATLRREHVQLGDGGRIEFEYVGKAGKEHVHALVDRDAYEVVKRTKLPPLRRRRRSCSPTGPTATGWRDVRSEDINAYLKELAGREYSAKDFRTWHATVLMAVALAVSVPASRSASGAKRAIARGVQEVGDLPRQHAGRVPQLLHRPARDRPLPGRPDHRGDPRRGRWRST